MRARYFKRETAFTVAAGGANSYDFSETPGLITGILLDLSMLITNTDAGAPHTPNMKAIREQFGFTLDAPDGFSICSNFDLEDLFALKHLLTGQGPGASWRDPVTAFLAGANATITEQVFIPFYDPRAKRPMDFALESRDCLGQLSWSALANQANFTAALTVNVAVIAIPGRSTVGLRRQFLSFEYSDVTKELPANNPCSDVVLISDQNNWSAYPNITVEVDGMPKIVNVDPDLLYSEEFFRKDYSARDRFLEHLPLLVQDADYSTQWIERRAIRLVWAGALPGGTTQKALMVFIEPNSPQAVLAKRPKLAEIPESQRPFVCAPKGFNPVKLALMANSAKIKAWMMMPAELGSTTNALVYAKANKLSPTLALSAIQLAKSQGFSKTKV